MRYVRTDNYFSDCITCLPLLHLLCNLVCQQGKARKFYEAQRAKGKVGRFPSSPRTLNNWSGLPRAAVTQIEAKRRANQKIVSIWMCEYFVLFVLLPFVYSWSLTLHPCAASPSMQNCGEVPASSSNCFPAQLREPAGASSVPSSPL